MDLLFIVGLLAALGVGLVVIVLAVSDPADDGDDEP